tara:strand:+ start:893 stop:1180 length:288 start_codon:yes stop_codon:yes gene_type:complete
LITGIGSNENPESLLGLKKRLEQLDNLPSERDELSKQRLELSGHVFDILSEQRSNREDLFKPVQELIQNNELIRDEYKLQLKAELDSTPEYIANQ